MNDVSSEGGPIQSLSVTWHLFGDTHFVIYVTRVLLRSSMCPDDGQGFYPAGLYVIMQDFCEMQNRLFTTEPPMYDCYIANTAHRSLMNCI